MVKEEGLRGVGRVKGWQKGQGLMGGKREKGNG